MANTWINRKRKKTITNSSTHIQARTCIIILQQDRQCTYNLTKRRFRESLLTRKSNKYYIFLCVCVCMCARVRACVWMPRRLGVCLHMRACGCRGAWACICACVHVALLIQHASRMRHIVTSLVAPLVEPYFSTLSNKGHCFLEKKLLNTKCVFLFSLQGLSKTFLNLRRI